jgi:hypothetical protein
MEWKVEWSRTVLYGAAPPASPAGLWPVASDGGIVWDEGASNSGLPPTTEGPPTKRRQLSPPAAAAAAAAHGTGAARAQPMHQAQQSLGITLVGPSASALVSSSRGRGASPGPQGSMGAARSSPLHTQQLPQQQQQQHLLAGESNPLPPSLRPQHYVPHVPRLPVRAAPGECCCELQGTASSLNRVGAGGCGWVACDRVRVMLMFSGADIAIRPGAC